MYDGIESTIFGGIIGSFLLMLFGQFLLVVLLWAFLLFIYMPAKKEEHDYNIEKCKISNYAMSHHLSWEEKRKLYEELDRKFGKRK